MDPERIVLADDGRFPNSVLPALVYRNAAQGPDLETTVERLFKDNGWPPQWVDTIFDYHHYHSTVHEVLGVVSGHGVLLLGGPEGETVELGAGDVVVIPAGVAHKRESASVDFAVVGAYPPGQDWDVLKGMPGDRDKAFDNLARLPLPTTDPVQGPEGPLLHLWT